MRSVHIAALVGLTVGCKSDVVFDASGGEEGIDRDVLTVTVRVAEADRESAEALGWTDGFVPRAEVRLQRETFDGKLGDSAVASTGSDGRVSFEKLRPGRYRASVLRLLQSEEVAAVEADRPTLRAFAGGDRTSSKGEFELLVQANRTGSLVVSELYRSDRGGSVDRFASYLEFYNNSDEIVHLDGMIVIKAYGLGHFDLSPSRPCPTTRRAALDSEGVWAKYFQAFPGSGATYPLGPGETVLVATDAIDHSMIAPGLPDLSAADFEFIGSADLDNPAVPNMMDIGLLEFSEGHGFYFSTGDVISLSAPVEIQSLVRDRVDPANDQPWVRFPAEALNDVAATTSEWPSELEPRAFCTGAVHPRFDRLQFVNESGFWADPTRGHSLQRRAVGVAPGGWTILLDTNTSAVDFTPAPRTPGTLPPP